MTRPMGVQEKWVEACRTELAIPVTPVFLEAVTRPSSAAGSFMGEEEKAAQVAGDTWALETSSEALVPKTGGGVLSFESDTAAIRFVEETDWLTLIPSVG